MAIGTRRGCRSFSKIRIRIALTYLLLFSVAGGVVAGKDIGELSEAAVLPEQEGNSFASVLTPMLKTPTGHQLLERARREWKLSSIERLSAKLVWDQVSRTDAILTRQYDPSSGKENRIREVSIHLKRDQNAIDSALDLSHELIHALSKPLWDPYDPELTAGKYIHAIIEGPGGEVEAMLSECQVAFELNIPEHSTTHRCLRYRSGEELSRKKIIDDFYRIGIYYDGVVQALGPEIGSFPFLSSDMPELYSSTGKAPYPAALLAEFEELTQVACQNSANRLSSLNGGERTDRHYRATRQFISRRCKQALNRGTPSEHV